MKRKWDKSYIVIGALNIALLIYILAIGLWAYFDNTLTLDIAGWKAPLIFALSLMFILELLSTIGFQFRIWLTSKNYIYWAALCGCFSWVIAGAQGILLVSSIFDGSNIWLSFLIKLPSVLIATYCGIILNVKLINKKKGKTDEKSCK